MNKKICILMIPIILLSITVFSKETLLGNTLVKTIEIKKEDDEKTINSIDKELTYLGEKYTLTNIQKDNIEIYTKEVKDIKEIELSYNNKEKVLSNFQKSINYDDNEYFGELEYIKDSLKILPISHGTYEKVFTIEKDYNDLDNNDLINIPKELLQSGSVYILTDCRWIPTEEQIINNVMTPVKYTANTIYKTVRKIDYPFTHKCSIEYKGTLNKKDYNDIRYILTYEKNVSEENKTPILPIIGGTGVFIIVLFLIFPNAKVSNYIEGKYKTLKYVRVSSKNPKINLKYLPTATTNVFKIEFSNSISNKLQGQFVTIVTSSGSIKKMIINNCIEVNI